MIKNIFVSLHPCVIKKKATGIRDMTVNFRCSGCLARIGVFAVLVIMNGGLFAASAVGQETAQTSLGNKLEAGKQIFEKVIDAQGGRELFSKIKDTTFSAEYKILPQGTEMTAVYYTKLPDRLRIDMRMMGGSPDVRAFNGKSGWRSLGARTLQEMTSPELEEFKNQALAAQGFLNPDMLKISPSLEGRLPVEGKDYLVLSYNNWGGFDTVYALIDPDTFLPHKFVNLKTDGRTEVINRDYREIDGLKLPYSFTLNIDGQMLLEMSIREWKLNSGLKDSLFEREAVAKGHGEGATDIARLDDDALQPVLIHSVEAVYPELAKRARVSGTVILHITIAEDGGVQDVKVMQGHPLLNQAAIEAVQQWRYIPAMRDGKPIPTATTVTISFKIGAQPVIIGPPF